MEESLKRGEAFEELVRTKGWEYIQGHFQARVQQFVTSLLIEGKKDIKEFENERRELIGLRRVIGMVGNDIKTLEDSRDAKKDKGVSKK